MVCLLMLGGRCRWTTPGSVPASFRGLTAAVLLILKTIIDFEGLHFTTFSSYCVHLVGISFRSDNTKGRCAGRWPSESQRKSANNWLRCRGGEKKEKKRAAKTFPCGNYVFALLPTGLNKRRRCGRGRPATGGRYSWLIGKLQGAKSKASQLGSSWSALNGIYETHTAFHDFKTFWTAPFQDGWIQSTRFWEFIVGFGKQIQWDTRFMLLK